jgi:predicted  nucleic acid-binding Zn-ribbon protein
MGTAIGFDATIPLWSMVLLIGSGAYGLVRMFIEMERMKKDMQEMDRDVSDIKNNQVEIKTDIKWIREKLDQ